MFQTGADSLLSLAVSPLTTGTLAAQQLCPQRHLTFTSRDSSARNREKIQTASRLLETAAAVCCSSFTRALCNSAEMFRGAPGGFGGGGRQNLGHMHGGSLGSPARTLYVCHGDLLLLFTSTSPPDERVTQS